MRFMIDPFRIRCTLTLTRTMEFYKSFLKFIETKYPHQFAAFGSHVPPSVLFSQNIIKISQADFNKIKLFIVSAFELAHSTSYINHIHPLLPDSAKLEAPNFSAFMSYDFHITPDGPKLIEINTNASLSSLSFLLSQFQLSHLNPSFLGHDFFNECKKMLLEEYHFLERSNPSRVAIIDEAPSNQRAYSEFLFYQSLFSEWGWKTDIIDTKDLDPKAYDLIYNRTTDFYFETEDTQKILEAYKSKSLCVTPNPREYGLLADKERLLIFSDEQKLRALGVSEDVIILLTSVVPKILPISHFSSESSKKEKEGYFFKPRRSFGAKAVYKGKSISNKIFEEILEKDYLAQELIEPPVVKVTTEKGESDFKWDLRVYAYKDQPQLMIARLYQGQTTNTQTPGGGLAAVILS